MKHEWESHEYLVVGMVGILCLPLLVVLVPLYVLGRIIVWTGMLDGVDAW